LTGVRLHDLRHFSGHQTARVANLAETMKRMGHSTQQAALIYSGVVSGRDAEVALALSALATKPKLTVVEKQSRAQRWAELSSISRIERTSVGSRLSYPSYYSPRSFILAAKSI
jgi:hypothetical protein